MGATQVLESRDQWLQARAEGIGSSDAAVVMGLSPWKSPLALYAEKIGLVDPADLSEVERVRWGKILEEPIAVRYAEVTGRTVTDPGEFAIDRHPVHGQLLASVDRYVDDPAKGRGILEIKTASAYKKSDWMEEPPVAYQVQLQHQLMVTGLTWGSLAVLIGGQEFYHVDLERNNAFIDVLLEAELEFWNRILRREPPDADGSESTRKALQAMYPQDTGEVIALSPDAWEWSEELEKIKGEIKQAEVRKAELENRLRAEIGSATKGLFSDGTGYTYKTQRRESYTVQAAEFRVLRRVKK